MPSPRPRSDILMITYKSADYVGLSLPRLLDTCGESDRVWLWHNGDDEATLDYLHTVINDPRIERFHHSRENVKLREPTRWLWANSRAEFVSKVDDDCLVSRCWIDIFSSAHRANPTFGVVGSWRHPEEDFRPDLARRKIQEFAGGHSLMRNLWVQGSGYLLKHSWIERVGTLRDTESFTGFCIRIARAGAVNGYYFPFVHEEHMDDPRSPYTLIETDEDLLERMPLSARANGVTTKNAWIAQLQRSAELLQSAPFDPRRYAPWRVRARRAGMRVARLRGKKAQW